MDTTESVADLQARLDEAQAAEARRQTEAEINREALNAVRGTLRADYELRLTDAQRGIDALTKGEESARKTFLVAMPPRAAEDGAGVPDGPLWRVVGPDEELPPGARTVRSLWDLFQKSFESMTKARDRDQKIQAREMALAADLDSPQIDAVGPFGAEDVEDLRAIAAEGLDRLEAEGGIRVSAEVRKVADEAVATGSPRAMADLVLALERKAHPDLGEVMVLSIVPFDQAPPGARVASLRRYLGRLAEIEGVCARYGELGGGVYADEQGRSTRVLHEMNVLRLQGDL